MQITFSRQKYVDMSHRCGIKEQYIQLQCRLFADRLDNRKLEVIGFQPFTSSMCFICQDPDFPQTRLVHPTWILETEGIGNGNITF